MQKKGIVKIAPVQPRLGGGCITAQKVDIRKQEVLIVDFFADKRYVHRIAFEGEDCSGYKVNNTNHPDKENEWSKIYGTSEIFAASSGYDDVTQKYISGRFPDWSRENGLHIDRASKKNISEYFGLRIGKDVLKFFDNRISDIRVAAQEKRMTARKKEMQEHFDGIPDVPQEFEAICENVRHKHNIIYYKRSKNYANYYCTACGKDYKLRTADYDDMFIAGKVFPVPQKGKVFTCPKCNEDGALEWWNRRTFYNYDEYKYLVQKNAMGEIVIRQFRVSGVRDNYGSCSVKVKDSIEERFRHFLRPKKTKTYYNWKNHYSYAYDHGLGYYANKYQTEDYWTTTAFGTNFYTSNWYDGIVIVEDGTLENSLLKYCDLDEYRRAYYDNFGYDSMFEVDCLRTYAMFPEMEMLYKAGFEGVALSAIRYNHIPALAKHGKTLADVLDIRKRDLKEVMHESVIGNETNGIRFYQSLKKHNIPEKEYEFWKEVLSSNNGTITSSVDYDMISALEIGARYHRTRGKFVKYLKAQNEKLKLSFRNILNEYRDYATLRNRLGYDMSNGVYAAPKDLKATYDALREEERVLKKKKDFTEAEQRFTDIPKRYKKLCRTYGCEVDDYIIRPASSATEIMKEGSTLHHCVGSLNQRYIGEHNQGKSYILFMRFKNDPSTPYITIQIKGAEILQWYGAYDKKQERDKIDKILEEYQEELRKNQKLLKTA